MKHPKITHPDAADIASCRARRAAGHVATLANVLQSISRGAGKVMVDECVGEAPQIIQRARRILREMEYVVEGYRMADDE